MEVAVGKPKKKRPIRKFLKGAMKQALEAADLSKEEFAYRVLPGFFLDLIHRYLRVKVEGVKNLPKSGPYIVIANHSGFMGFDALMLSFQIERLRKHFPRIIAHKMWFLKPEISVHAERFGLIPATLDNGFQILEQGEPLILFPEGEEGNFKPTKYRYRLRPFRRGFVRLALKTGVPIVPSVVIGAEETHITLSQIRWAKDLVGIIIPVPLNVVPLPAKWTIRFLKPIRLEKNPEKADDIRYVTRLSRQIRADLQREMHALLKDRGTVFT